MECVVQRGSQYCKILLAEPPQKPGFMYCDKKTHAARTAEGVRIAKLNGKQIGRKKGASVPTKKGKWAKQMIQQCSVDFNGTMINSELIKLIGVSRNSFYKYKRELKEEGSNLEDEALSEKEPEDHSGKDWWSDQSFVLDTIPEEIPLRDFLAYIN